MAEAPAGQSVIWRSDFKSDDAYFDALLLVGKDINDCEPRLRVDYARWIQEFNDNSSVSNLSDVSNLPPSVSDVPPELVFKKHRERESEFEAWRADKARTESLAMSLAQARAPPQAQVQASSSRQRHPTPSRPALASTASAIDSLDAQEVRLAAEINSETRKFQEHANAYNKAAHEAVERQSAMTKSTTRLLELSIQLGELQAQRPASGDHAKEYNHHVDYDMNNNKNNAATSYLGGSYTASIRDQPEKSVYSRVTIAPGASLQHPMPSPRMIQQATALLDSQGELERSFNNNDGQVHYDHDDNNGNDDEEGSTLFPKNRRRGRRGQRH